LAAVLEVAEQQIGPPDALDEPGVWKQRLDGQQVERELEVETLGYFGGAGLAAGLVVEDDEAAIGGAVDAIYFAKDPHLVALLGVADGIGGMGRLRVARPHAGIAAETQLEMRGYCGVGRGGL
jgi:hypothetical protein